LLRSTNYSSPIDIWAVGTIIVELFNLTPLFPGQTEIDQLFKITNVLGIPQGESREESNGQSPSSKVPIYNQPKRERDRIFGGGVWGEGLRLASRMGFRFTTGNCLPISQVIPAAPTQAVVIVADMLLYNPHKRPTASEALRYEWFENEGTESIIAAGMSPTAFSDTSTTINPYHSLKPKTENIHKANDPVKPNLAIPNYSNISMKPSRTEITPTSKPIIFEQDLKVENSQIVSPLTRQAGNKSEISLELLDPENLDQFFGKEYQKTTKAKIPFPEYIAQQPSFEAATSARPKVPPLLEPVKLTGQYIKQVLDY
jgi:serine/threonine protein kinase